MGHRTDAATVYEKGVCLDTAQRGLLRAIQLFQELAPSTKVASMCVEWGTEKLKKPITIPSEMFSSFIGADIKPAEIKKIFTELGFTLKVSGKNTVITPPQWRSDVTMKQDLVEEIARIYGYANVSPMMPEASIAIPPRDHRINALRTGLKEARFTELLHLAFTNPGLLKKCGMNALDAVAIENPIGEELSLMRTSLLPSMLETIGRELKTLDGKRQKAYEYGRVFKKGQPEALELCAIVASKGKTTIADDPSLILKSDLATVFHGCGYELSFKKTTRDISPFAHGGRSAVILAQGKEIGFLTELHPSIRSAFDLQGRVSVAIMNLDLLRSLLPATLITSPLPLFPAVEFDETMILGKTAHAEIVTKAKAIDPLLQSIRILHFYEAEGVKNVTLRFTYRANDRTLVQSDVEKVHGKVMEEIKKM